jgi:tetratricopeptide (TPR) repeat protein
LSIIHSCRADAEHRNPHRAEEIANKALQIDPNASNHWTALGLALYRQSKWEQARTAFEKSLTLTGTSYGALRWDEAINWFGLAMSHCQESQVGQATECYRRAIQEIDNGLGGQTDDELVRRIRTEAEKLLEIAGANEATQEARGLTVQIQSKIAHAHQSLGNAYAMAGQWERAVPEFRHAVDLDRGSDPEAHYKLAALCLYLGDIEEYRTTCRAMLERFSTSPNRNFIDRTAKICLLARDPDENRERALKLADQNVLGTEKHFDYRWFVLAKALADYRANRFAEALKQLEQIAPQEVGGHLDALTFALIAIVHQRLDHYNKARGALASAQDILANAMPNPKKGRFFGDDWNDWMHCQILVRDAERMIETAPSGSNEKSVPD